MFEQIPPKDRWVTVSFLALFFAITGFIGARSLKQPAQIVLKPQYGADSSSKPVSLQPADLDIEPSSREPEAETKVANGLDGPIHLKSPVKPRRSSKTPVEKKPAVRPAPQEIDANGLTKQDRIRMLKSKESTWEKNPYVNLLKSPDRDSAQGSISVNNASQRELESLPGVGPSIAAAIVKYRRDKGRFTSIDQLENVKGIGPKKMQQIRSRVRL